MWPGDQRGSGGGLNYDRGFGDSGYAGGFSAPPGGFGGGAGAGQGVPSAPGSVRAGWPGVSAEAVSGAGGVSTFGSGGGGSPAFGGGMFNAAGGRSSFRDSAAGVTAQQANPIFGNNLVMHGGPALSAGPLSGGPLLLGPAESGAPLVGAVGEEGPLMRAHSSQFASPAAFNSPNLAGRDYGVPGTVGEPWLASGKPPGQRAVAGNAWGSENPGLLVNHQGSGVHSNVSASRSSSRQAAGVEVAAAPWHAGAPSFVPQTGAGASSGMVGGASLVGPPSGNVYIVEKPPPGALPTGSLGALPTSGLDHASWRPEGAGGGGTASGTAATGSPVLYQTVGNQLFQLVPIAGPVAASGTGAAPPFVSSAGAGGGFAGSENLAGAPGPPGPLHSAPGRGYLQAAGITSTSAAIASPPFVPGAAGNPSATGTGKQGSLYASAGAPPFEPGSRTGGAGGYHAGGGPSSRGAAPRGPASHGAPVHDGSTRSTHGGQMRPSHAQQKADDARPQQQKKRGRRKKGSLEGAPETGQGSASAGGAQQVTRQGGIDSAAPLEWGRSDDLRPAFGVFQRNAEPSGESSAATTRVPAANAVNTAARGGPTTGSDARGMGVAAGEPSYGTEPTSQAATSRWYPEGSADKPPGSLMEAAAGLFGGRRSGFADGFTDFAKLPPSIPSDGCDGFHYAGADYRGDGFPYVGAGFASGGSSGQSSGGSQAASPLEAPYGVGSAGQPVNPFFPFLGRGSAASGARGNGGEGGVGVAGASGVLRAGGRRGAGASAGAVVRGETGARGPGGGSRAGHNRRGEPAQVKGAAKREPKPRMSRPSATGSAEDGGSSKRRQRGSTSSKRNLASQGSGQSAESRGSPGEARQSGGSKSSCGSSGSAGGVAASGSVKDEGLSGAKKSPDGSPADKAQTASPSDGVSTIASAWAALAASLTAENSAELKVFRATVAARWGRSVPDSYLQATAAVTGDIVGARSSSSKERVAASPLLDSLPLLLNSFFAQKALPKVHGLGLSKLEAEFPAVAARHAGRRSRELREARESRDRSASRGGSSRAPGGTPRVSSTGSAAERGASGTKTSPGTGGPRESGGDSDRPESKDGKGPIAKGGAVNINEELEKLVFGRTVEGLDYASVAQAAKPEFARDPVGALYLVRSLARGGEEASQAVFLGLVGELAELSQDQHGHAVVEALFFFGTEEQRRNMAEQLVGTVLDLALHQRGCRVIQRALKCLGVDQQVLLVGELKSQIMACVEDANANHVVQRCIQEMPSGKIQFIVDSVVPSLRRVATHAFGCRVLQRLLEDGAEAQRGAVLDAIGANLAPLCQDMFGNYVVQHTLLYGRDKDLHRIFEVVRANVVEFSSKKFASNVIERTLGRIGPEDRKALVSTILGTTGPDDDPEPPVAAMMRDRYGNYVVQRVLDYCVETFPESRRQLEALRRCFQQGRGGLVKLNYGKHLLSYFAKQEARVGELLGEDEPFAAIGSISPEDNGSGLREGAGAASAGPRREPASSAGLVGDAGTSPSVNSSVDLSAGSADAPSSCSGVRGGVSSGSGSSSGRSAPGSARNSPDSQRSGPKRPVQ